MRSNLRTVMAAVGVVLGLTGLGLEQASAQTSEAAPAPATPGIIVTPGTSRLPKLPSPESREDARGSQPGRDGGQRQQPNGGCQYNERRLELIV